MYHFFFFADFWFLMALKFILTCFIIIYLFSHKTFWSIFSSTLFSQIPHYLIQCFFSLKKDRTLQTITKKKPPQIYGDCFALVSYPWAWGLLWRVTDKSSVTSSEKTDFLSLSRYQLQVTYLLEVRFCDHFAGALSDLNLFRSCACCHSLCDFLCIPALLCLKVLFSWSNPPLALKSFCFFSVLLSLEVSLRIW